jgi:N-acetyl-anhydromuramyl-L-alanine amidase AmpD
VIPPLEWIRKFWASPGQPATGHPDPLPSSFDLRVDAEGWLVGGNPGSVLRPHVDLQRVPSVRHSALTTREPMAIVWHYTATDIGTARSLARRIRTYRSGVDRAASWHVIIAHDGVIWQSVPFLRGAWHCARGRIAGHRVNACSVGVELEGHGTSFSEDQVWAAEMLVRALRDAYEIDAVNADRGHREFDPARRADPGPVWEALLPDLVRRVYGLK